MDDVLVDFKSGVARLDRAIAREYRGRLQEVPGIYSLMEPMPDAIESFIALATRFDTYILSAPPWNSYSAPSDKFQWVRKHLGKCGYQRLILTHHKYLSIGDYLIDSASSGEEFIGEHLQFGSYCFPNWRSVLDYLVGSKTDG